MIRSFPTVAFACLVGLSTIGIGTSLGVQAELSPSILQVTSGGDGKDLVIVDGVETLGLLPGDILTARRSSSAPGSVINSGVQTLLETGSIKVVRVDAGVAFAAVLKDGTSVSRQVFPKFPGLMAGDVLSRANIEIAPNVALTPIISLPYHRIFAAPGTNSSNYELNESGKRILQAEVVELARQRLSRITVEGYTDTNGSADLSQIESYQRALTVRQFLINEAGFDQDRIVALGFGESDPLPGPRSPDSGRLNRRIVIKVLPQVGM